MFLFNDADGSSDYVAPNNIGVPFIASPNSAALPHRKPASAGISRDSCSVQGHDRRDIQSKMIDQ